MWFPNRIPVKLKKREKRTKQLITIAAIANKVSTKRACSGGNKILFATSNI